MLVAILIMSCPRTLSDKTGLFKYRSKLILLMNNASNI